MCVFLDLLVFIVYYAFTCIYFPRLTHGCISFCFFVFQVDEVTDLLASFTSLSLQKQNLGDR